MSAAEVLAELHERNIALEARGDRLRVSPSEALTDELRQLIRQYKSEIIEHLSKRERVSRLPWQLERLVSAAATGVLIFEFAGIYDVNRYVLAWGCAYLTGDRTEALRRLWDIHFVWQKNLT